MKERFEGLIEHLLSGNVPLDEATEILERSMIQRALEKSGGNQSAASKTLGIHRNTLQRKMHEYGIGNGKPPRKKPATRAAAARKRKSPAA